jgi:hypothetical protein
LGSLDLLGRLLELLLHRGVGQLLGGLLDQLPKLGLLGEAEGVLQDLVGVLVGQLLVEIDERLGVQPAADHVHPDHLKALGVLVERRVVDHRAPHRLEAQEGGSIVAVVAADDAVALGLLLALGQGPHQHRVGQPGLLDVVDQEIELARAHPVRVALVFHEQPERDVLALELPGLLDRRHLGVDLLVQPGRGRGKGQSRDGPGTRPDITPPGGASLKPALIWWSRSNGRS